MITVNKFESKYKPIAEFNGSDITHLFPSVRIVKHCTQQPNDWIGEFTLSIDGFFNGKSFYVRICDELIKLLTQVSIYGDPMFKDIYLKVTKRQGQYCLVMQYQQILGSYHLFNITQDQYNDLINLVSEA